MNGAILKREAGIIKNKIASLAEAYSQANFNRSEKKAFNDFSVSSIFESRTDKPDQLSESLNINGQVVTERQIKEQNTLFNLSSYDKGIYIIKIKNDTGVSVHKLVVK